MAGFSAELDLAPERLPPGRRVRGMRGRVGTGVAAALSSSVLLVGPVASQAPGAEACGAFEYTYPYNTEHLNENHFIVLACSEDPLQGWYYGTSDDLDPGREGYLPGFFVAEMGDLNLTGDQIRFTIEVPADAYFASPVPLIYRRAECVPRDRYESWRPGMPAGPRYYRGTISADAIVLQIDGGERVFVRVERDPHGRLDRSGR
jgi:hypothetical protein